MRDEDKKLIEKIVSNTERWRWWDELSDRMCTKCGGDTPTRSCWCDYDSRDGMCVCDE